MTSRAPPPPQPPPRAPRPCLRSQAAGVVGVDLLLEEEEAVVEEEARQVRVVRPLRRC